MLRSRVNPPDGGRSSAAVGIAHEELPGAIGLTTKNLDRLVVDLDRLAWPMDRRALEVGVPQRDIVDRDGNPGTPYSVRD